MRSIFVADVDDGLCAAVFTVSGRSVQIDCGGQEGEIAFRGLNRILNFFPNLDAFILSHFHIDHYNGLLHASLNSRRYAPFEIKEVYYPRIPVFKEREEFLKCLFSMNLRVFGSETGVMEYDFLKAVSRINAGSSFKKKSLSKGEIINIDGSTFEILWPPTTIDTNTLSVVRRAIEDFEKAMEEDAETRQLYERVQQDDVFRDYLGEQNERSNFAEHSDRYLKAKWEKRKLPEIVAKANDSLREAANHLSLAFFEDNRLLFLGDLENYEIKQVACDLNLKGRKCFYVFITPHHGTHWDDNLRMIKCIYSVASNGRKSCSKMKTHFKEISERSLATFVNGDIIIPTYLAGGLWSAAPLWF